MFLYVYKVNAIRLIRVSLDSQQPKPARPIANLALYVVWIGGYVYKL